MRWAVKACGESWIFLSFLFLFFHISSFFCEQRLTDYQAAMDEAIYKKEGEYLESTPHGNILTGFDNYIKGVTSNGVGGGRRKAGVGEADRVFSRSSMRIAGSGDAADSPGVLSALTTPSGAPTPVAGTARESGHATPTSATSKSGAGKKNKRGKVGGEAEDSEMEEREGKKRAGARK